MQKRTFTFPVELEGELIGEIIVEAKTYEEAMRLASLRADKIIQKLNNAN